MNLEYVLSIEGAERLYLQAENICNDDGRTIAEISCVGGRLSAYVNAVHCIRPNNVKSLAIADTIKLELIYSKVISFMNDYLKRNPQEQYSEEHINGFTVTKLECKITLPCVNGASASDAISLFEQALNKTVLHRQRKTKDNHNIIVTGCYFIF